MANNVSRADCVASARAAGATDLEAAQIVDQLLKEKERLSAAGQLDDAARKLSELWSGKVDQMRRVALQRRRHAALTVLRRQEFDAFIETVKAQGFSFMDGVEAAMVGNAKRFDGARLSVSAQRKAVLQGWLGPMLNELERIGDGDTLKLMRNDKRFHDDVIREMRRPGSTADDVARQAADIFARYMEQARARLNDAGADIGRLDGWTPQSHDAWKMLKGGGRGREDWISFTAERLDVERSFPDAAGDPARLREILGRVYDSIVTGHDGHVTPAERGQRTGPRNLASGMGEHRVLHFRDADAALAYNEKYGHGNLIDAMVRHLDMAARKTALMERFGPNPQALLESAVEAEKRRLATAADLDPSLKKQRMDELNAAFSGGIIRGGKVAHWLAELTGETNWAANPTAARVMSIARATQTLSKLGGATLSAVADVFIKASAMRVNGLSWPEAMTRSLTQYVHAYSGEEREAARQLGVFIDATLGDMHARWDLTENFQGRLGDLQNQLFKWSGLNWITERGKAGYALWLSQHLGEVAGKTLDAMDPARRALLAYHGIDATHWDVLRRMTETTDDGRTLFVPSRALELPDAALEGLLPPESRQTARPEGLDPLSRWQRRRDRELTRLRNRLQTDSLAMIADETGFAIIEPDDKTRAFMRHGTRPGTVAGELWRSIMQFKSFPIAYLQRAVGGRRWVRGELQEGMRHGWNMGSVGDALTRDMGGLTGYTLSALAFGYASMTLKDLAKGRQPRDPRKLETLLAAAVQSGGAGIYGDFFLAKVNRFGNDLAGTLAGPLAGAAGQALPVPGMLLRGEGRDAGEQAIRTALDNAPFINLWYTRAALDWTLLYHVREWMSPGTLRRMERKMKKDFNQDMLISPSRHIRKGGGFRQAR